MNDMVVKENFFTINVRV